MMGKTRLRQTNPNTWTRLLVHVDGTRVGRTEVQRHEIGGADQERAPLIHTVERRALRIRR